MNRIARMSLMMGGLVLLGAAGIGMAQEPAGAMPAAPKAEGGPVVEPGKAAIEWVSIPGGSFVMGSGTANEAPAHRVTIKSFQMAKTLVTNKQYQACVRAGTCTAPKDEGERFKGDDQPVVGVDWDQARTFAKWAGGRLPSEAEWEYAARSAGKDYKYPWGDAEATCERAVIDAGGNGCGRNATWPVCSKPAGNTKQGLCDMAGNAWEWVQDLDHHSYSGAPTDGGPWEDPETPVVRPYRIRRGGSWYGAAEVSRATWRGGGEPGDRRQTVGFRLARAH